MSFGHQHFDPNDIRFDSKEEARVAEELQALTHERLLRGVWPHPSLAGFDIDFLILTGQEHDTPGQVIVVEYDGLGTQRRHTLEPKIARLADLATYGIETRWLVDPTPEGVRQLVTNYVDPPLVRVIRICKHCGDERSLMLFDRTRTHTPGGTVEQRRPCSFCQGR